MKEKAIDKLINYLKEKSRKIKSLKRQLENKNQLIEEQAETINCIIQEKNEYKQKCLELQRKLREAKKVIK